MRLADGKIILYPPLLQSKSNEVRHVKGNELINLLCLNEKTKTYNLALKSYYINQYSRAIDLLIKIKMVNKNIPLPFILNSMKKSMGNVRKSRSPHRIGIVSKIKKIVFCQAFS